MKKHFFFLILGMAVLLVVTATAVTASASNKYHSRIYTTGDQDVVHGAKAQLSTNNDKITMSVNTKELTPGDVVTVWWIIFNNPEECANGTPGIANCAAPDLFNPAVQAEVLFADGAVIEQNGKGKYSAELYQGFVPRGWFGNGLLSPTGAEVHLVIRTHGQAIPGIINDMITTFGGACSNVPAGHPSHNEILPGTPGPNECADIQFAVFEQ